MRFLFVSEFLPRRNTGAEGTLLAIGDALEKCGNQVDYLWKDTDQEYFWHARLHTYFLLPELQLRRVDQVLTKSNYDVVIISQPYSYLIYEQLTSKYPKTLFINRTHGWEQRLTESSARLKWRPAPMCRKPFRAISEGLLARACARTAGSCSGMITGSHLCARYIQERYKRAENTTAVIPYGVEPAALRNYVKRPPSSSPRLLFVGQHLLRKGSHVLESELPMVARAFPDVEITFVLPDEAILQANRVFRPIFGSRLTLRSWTSREVLTSIYREHDILLFPSLFEGFGKVFLEGMAAGLCVVGFSEGGLPDVALHGRDALLCEPGDTLGFRQLLTWAIQNPARAESIGGQAREVAKRFTWDRHARETVDFCLQLKPSAARDLVAR